MAEKKLNLVYVDGRGNAERIRFVLAGAGLDWTETYWNTKQDLIDMVASGRLVGDQVPLLETPEGIDVSQSWTVIRYIARFHGLEPEGAANIVKADAVAEIIREFEKGAGLVGYGWVDKEISKKAFQETADKWFPRFEKSVTGPYFLGEKPFYCDFVLLNSLLFVDEVITSFCFFCYLGKGEMGNTLFLIVHSLAGPSRGCG